MKTVPIERGGLVTELSIMKKLLMPAAEVLAMDATDSSCGDRLLKEAAKKVSALVSWFRVELVGCWS